MIAITRTEPPDKLERSKAKDAWKSVVEVRATLRDMQAGKCCYCEAKIPECGPRQQIEHYWPKSNFTEKRNLWANLLLACDLCNGNKDDCFPLDNLCKPLVIDPTSNEVNPESELTFTTTFHDVVEYRLIGRTVSTKNSLRGDATINVVALNSDHHRRERRAHYEETLLPWLAQYVHASELNDVPEVEALRDRIERLMDGRAKYAGFVRAFARHYNLPVTVPGGLSP